MATTLYPNIAARNESLQGFVTGWRQKQERYKGRELAPVKVVPAIRGNFPTAPVNQDLRIPNTHWDGIKAIPGRALTYSNQDYALALHSQGVTQSDYQQPSVPPENIPEASIRNATAALYLKFESEMQTKMTTLANFLSSHRTTLTSGTQFNDAGSDPLGVAQDAKAAITLAADTDFTQISAPLAVWQAWAKHAQIQELVKYTSEAGLDKMTVNRIANAMDFDRGVVLDASYDSSAQNGTAAIARLWGNHVVYQALDANPAEGTSAHAVTLSLDDDIVRADSWMPSPWLQEYYAVGSWVILITNSYAGYLVRDAVA